MTHFKIITASWNCMDKLPGCLQSIADQTYTDYEVCVIDDASDDVLHGVSQAQFIKNVCTEYHQFKSILRETKECTLKNQVDAIRFLEPDDEDVIVFLDGDDKFSHNNVLKHLSKIYQIHEPDMTYGNYTPVPLSSTCPKPQPYPEECVRNNDYRNARKYGILFNHLRSLKYKLFKHLDDDVDFKDQNGNWYTVAGDTAVMIPCLELAGGNYHFVSEPLIDYTSNSELADWRMNAKEINSVHDRIFLKTPRKKPLKEKE